MGIEASSRMKLLEDRISGIDNKICEIGNREVLHYDELQTNQRKLSNNLDEIRDRQVEQRSRGEEMRHSHVADVENLRNDLSATGLSQADANDSALMPRLLPGFAFGAASSSLSSPARRSTEEVIGTIGDGSMSVGRARENVRSLSPLLTVQRASASTQEGVVTSFSPPMTMQTTTVPGTSNPFGVA